MVKQTAADIKRRGALCRDCGQFMLEANGCSVSILTLENKKDYKRIKATGSGRCHDCGAKPRYYHHGGCDMERCPKHPNQQSISCNDCNGLDEDNIS